MNPMTSSAPSCLYYMFWQHLGDPSEALRRWQVRSLLLVHVLFTPARDQNSLLRLMSCDMEAVKCMCGLLWETESETESDCCGFDEMKLGFVDEAWKERISMKCII